MNSHRLSLVLAVLALAVPSWYGFGEPAASDEKGQDEIESDTPAGFTRYQSILDRMPFGEPPPGFDATLPPGSAAAQAAAAEAAANGELTPEQRTEEEQKMAASVRVSILNVTPAGRTMVGFTDNSAQPPEHYYLPVGGEKNGWEVKDAVPAEEKVTLAHGGVEVTVKLGEGAQGDGKGKGKGGVNRPTMNPMRRGGMLGGRMQNVGGAPAAPGTPTASGGAVTRLRARRMQREQEEAKRRSEAAAEEKAEKERRAAEAEQAAQEREQQRNALLQIQEELRRAREEKAAAKSDGDAAKVDSASDGQE